MFEIEKLICQPERKYKCWSTVKKKKYSLQKKNSFFGKLLRSICEGKVRNLFLDILPNLISNNIFM